jgi:hypothetical protein
MMLFGYGRENRLSYPVYCLAAQTLYVLNLTHDRQIVQFSYVQTKIFSKNLFLKLYQ